jgi:hypothetical protein
MSFFKDYLNLHARFAHARAVKQKKRERLYRDKHLYDAIYKAVRSTANSGFFQTYVTFNSEYSLNEYEAQRKSVLDHFTELGYNCSWSVKTYSPIFTVSWEKP